MQLIEIKSLRIVLLQWHVILLWDGLIFICTKIKIKNSKQTKSEPKLRKNKDNKTKKNSKMHR